MGWKLIPIHLHVAGNFCVGSVEIFAGLANLWTFVLYFTCKWKLWPVKPVNMTVKFQPKVKDRLTGTSEHQACGMSGKLRLLL